MEVDISMCSHNAVVEAITGEDEDRLTGDQQESLEYLKYMDFPAVVSFE